MILYKCLNHGGRLVSRLFHVWQVENGRCVCVCVWRGRGNGRQRFECVNEYKKWLIIHFYHHVFSVYNHLLWRQYVYGAMLHRSSTCRLQMLQNKKCNSSLITCHHNIYILIVSTRKELICESSCWKYVRKGLKK